MSRLTNSEWLSYIANDINEKPSISSAMRMAENDFVDIFTDNEGNPIERLNYTLNGIVEDERHVKNLFFNVFYNRVVRAGVIDALTIPNKLGIFYKGVLEYGEGWSRTMMDIMDDEEYSRTGSPIETNFENTEDKTVEVFSDVPIRRIVRYSKAVERGINEAFTRSDYGIHELLALMFKRANDAIAYRVDTELRNILTDKDDAPFVDIVLKKSENGYSIPDKSAVEGLKLNDFTNDSVMTAQGIAYFINTLIGDMSEATRNYNKGNEDGKFMTSLPRGEAVLIIDDKALSALNVRDDSLFGAKSSIKDVKEVITISNLKEIEKGKRVLFTLSHSDVIEYKTMLDENTDFTNARTLDKNFFNHYWFATLSNPFVPAVRVIIEDDTEEAE